MLNKEKFEYCRIPKWHEAGYTGKGIKVAVFEDITRGHGRMVADILRQVMPDAIILGRPRPGPIEINGDKLAPDTRVRMEAFYRDLVAEGVHMCVMSLSGWGAKEMEVLEQDILIANGVVLFTSAGNEKGKISPSSSASLPTWIAVGACVLVNGKPQRVNYSNYGPELDVMGFTNLQLTYGGVFEGTSCANPFVAGLCGLWFQWFEEQYGRTPNQAETLEFIRKNSEDLGELGRDDKHGYGLLVLPEKIPSKEEKKLKVYLSPSTQERNIGAGKYGTEEQRMNEIVDVMESDLLRHGFHIKRNKPDMTLMEVVQDSNNWKPDIHVAIHSNAGGGKGTEVLYYSDEGYRLAKCIYDELAMLTPWVDRGAKRRLDLYELKYTIAPACIVEIAFHDDPEQAEWIIEHKDDIARAIVKGICKYAGVPWQDDGIKKIPLDVPAQVQNGRTLVPLRAICEALGALVFYDDKTREITITQGDIVLKLKVGGKEIMKIQK